LGFKVFVSAVDIQLGDAWLKEIENALEGSTILLSLCSPSSVRRPWLNFESGSGWSKGVKVVPICYKGLRKDKLPAPLHIFQAVELTDFVSCRKLVDKQFSVASTEVEAHLRNKFSDFVLFLSILCRRFNNRAWYSYEVALIINFSLKVKSILSL
jgi:TIR domain